MIIKNHDTTCIYYTFYHYSGLHYLHDIMLCQRYHNHTLVMISWLHQEANWVILLSIQIYVSTLYGSKTKAHLGGWFCDTEGKATCLWCQNPKWMLVHVLNASLLIQLPGKDLGKALENSPRFWVSVTHTVDLDKAPGFLTSTRSNPGCCSHLRNEPTDGRSPSLCNSNK